MSDELWRRVVAAGRGAGLDVMGVTAVRSWTSTRVDLERRRAHGYASTMQFTYRAPARSTEPNRILAGARRIVVGAVDYGGRTVAPDDDVPTDGPVARAAVARYAAMDHHRRLQRALGAAAAVIRDAGHRAVVVADDNALVDREAAWRAGIGWYGKNSLLLVPGRGSWFVLGSVVTDAPIPLVGEPRPDGCGTCERCLPACPTGAIVAPGVVDAGRCLSWILQAPGRFPMEYRRSLGHRVYGCDDCQEACPPSRAAELRFRRQNGPGTVIGFIDVVEALAVDDVELMSRVPHWYVPGRDGSVIRRNLLIVAGNVGDGRDAELLAAVAAQTHHGDDAVVDAARWALAEIAERGSEEAMAPTGSDRDDGPS